MALRDAKLYEITKTLSFNLKLKATFRYDSLIPEPFGIVIHTPQGKIVCTETLLDFTPVGNQLTSTAGSS